LSELATGWWFSPGTPVSSTNKTDRHDITEMLLKVALNTITQTKAYLTCPSFNLNNIYFENNHYIKHSNYIQDSETSNYAFINLSPNIQALYIYMPFLISTVHCLICDTLFNIMIQLLRAGFSSWGHPPSRRLCFFPYMLMVKIYNF